METGDNRITVPGMSHKPPVRFGQFTLRSLLILMALVAAFFGGRATMMPRLAEERAKVRKAERQLAAKRATVPKAVQVRIVPLVGPMAMPVSLESMDAQDRAERANLLEHQRRWRNQRFDLPAPQVPMDNPRSELRFR